MKIDFDKFGTRATLVGSMLIFFSIIKAMIYYYTYGIWITDYITFGEALLLFFDDILLFSFMTVIFIAIVIFGFPDENLKGEEAGFWKNGLINLLTIMLLISISYDLYRIFYKFYGWNIIDFSFLMVFVILISAIAFRYLNKGEKDPTMITRIINRKRINLSKAMFIFFLLLTAGALTQIEMRLSRLNKKEIPVFVTCYLSDTTIFQATGDTVFLGKTSNYIFFYSFIANQSIIYKTDDITKTVLTKNKNYKNKMLRFF